MTDINRAEYEQKGYLTGIALVSPQEATHIRDQFDALEASVGRETARIGLVDYHCKYEFLWNLVNHPKVIDTVQTLLGEDVLLLATHFFCKYGQEERFVAWHQDVTYWGLEPPKALTIWYAIDASDVENGCMRVIPGTHSRGIREHGKSDQAGNLLSINQEVPTTAEENASAVNLVLKAGEFSIHDGALIHGSLPNRSNRRRCGLTMRFVATSVGQTDATRQSDRWHPVLFSGEDREHHFDLQPKPCF